LRSKSFASADDALAELKHDTRNRHQRHPMPGYFRLDLLQRLRERFPNLPVIIMTAYSDLESAVSSFQAGR